MTAGSSSGSRRGRQPRPFQAVAAIALIGSWACAAAARTGGRAEAPDSSHVFEMLAGDWAGEGILFGQPARFTMRWTPVGDGRYQLDFTNGMLGDGGQLTPILSAVAIYTPARDGMATAEWTDDRPQQISIMAQMGDSVLVSDWTAPTESGRTEYRVGADGSVRVSDWVRSNGELRPFGEAVYRRR